MQITAIVYDNSTNIIERISTPFGAINPRRFLFMKKCFSVLFVVLVLMSIFTTTVFAAPAASKSVSLVSVQYQAGGIVLLFETSGLTKADLKDNSFYAFISLHQHYLYFSFTLSNFSSTISTAPCHRCSTTFFSCIITKNHFENPSVPLFSQLIKKTIRINHLF